MFENLKKNFQKKIEENSVKSEMEWEDKEGNRHSEIVYMKRSNMPFIGDWVRIYPPVNEDSSWNVPNAFFGGRKNLIKLLLILGVVALFILAWLEARAGCNNLLENQCIKNCLSSINP